MPPAKKTTAKKTTATVRARRSFVPAGSNPVSVPDGEELPDRVVVEGQELPADDPRVVAQPWEFETG